jgi:hypothetical protein
MRHRLMLIAMASLLGACQMAKDANQDYIITIHRTPEDVLTALDEVGGDISSDYMMPFLASSKLTIEHPDPASQTITIPGDTPDKEIKFSFTLTPRDDGAATELHVVSNLPAKIGTQDGAHKLINGVAMADTLHHEVKEMARSLDDGRDASEAAGSFKMALHALAMSNRRESEDEFARIARNPQAYGEKMGREAADRYIASSNLTPEQRERVSKIVHDSLDKSHNQAPADPGPPSQFSGQ